MPRRTQADPETARIGARVRNLRLERHMSLGELSDVTQISKGHLSGIEHGLAAITIPTILRLAKGLELPAFYLLTSPPDDDRAHIMELARQLPPVEIVKLRRVLVKLTKEVAKTAAKAARTPPMRTHARGSAIAARS